MNNIVSSKDPLVLGKPVSPIERLCNTTLIVQG